MIDFHTHTFNSDGELIASELAARAAAAGYRALAITDHVDESNMEEVIEQTLRFTASYKGGRVKVVPGVEITHVAPEAIGPLAARARKLGAKIVVCHGETIVEPVEAGTNSAAIRAGVDILAHPGLVSAEDAVLAAKAGVYFEITSRKGHSLTNGHVAAAARKHGVGLIVNTDTHSPGDLITVDTARRVAIGANMTEEEFKIARKNAETLLEKILG
ncbi:MAG: histidinol phosphate phosphatase domain-containing protein [Deltaproteobacteria bacterium]|nr:histidinol phosphate phosphatase domain-containing protein [Deltaproteobacteria bacterium]